MYEDESLGSYHSPEATLDDLVGGHTFFPSNGVDPSECGLPDVLADWTFVRTARSARLSAVLPHRPLPMYSPRGWGGSWELYYTRCKNVVKNKLHGMQVSR